MLPFALVLDSPDADGRRARALVDALRRANPDDLPLIVVSAQGDDTSFGTDVPVVARASLSVVFLPPSEPGAERINRERLAMAFWDTGLAEHYTVLPPDLLLLREVRRQDFWHVSGVPYSFLSEDPEASVDPATVEAARRERTAVLSAAGVLGLEERRMLASRGVDVLSSVSMRSLKESVLDPRGLDYAQALEILPSAGTWHGLWLLASGERPVVLRETLVRTVVSPGDREDLLVKQVTRSDLSRGYLAAEAGGPGLPPPTAPSRASAIAREVTVGTLMRAVLLRALRRMPRVTRALGAGSRPA